jgi:DNA-binding response OmpR family regulator
LDNRQVSTGNGAQKLTPQLCRLLEVFMLNPEKILSRKFLMKEVWETDYIGDTRTLEVHICWLRKKIEEDPRHPRYLRTVRGVGYHFSVLK